MPVLRLGFIGLRGGALGQGCQVGLSFLAEVDSVGGFAGCLGRIMTMVKRALLFGLGYWLIVGAALAAIRRLAGIKKPT